MSIYEHNSCHQSLTFKGIDRNKEEYTKQKEIKVQREEENVFINEYKKGFLLVLTRNGRYPSNIITHVRYIF